VAADQVDDEDDRAAATPGASPEEVGSDDQQEQDANPAFLQHPISFLSWWWTEKQPNHITTLFLGVVGTLLTTGLVVGVGLLISLLVGAGKVPGYALAIAIGAGLAIGLLSAWLITRAFYELRLQLSDRTHELEQQQSQENLLDARRQLSELEPDRRALRRLGAYSDYVFDLIEGLIRGNISLQDLNGEQVKRNICVAPQALLRKMTGQDYYMSIWLEGTAGLISEGMHRIVEALPIREDRADRFLTFQILCAPDHTSDECEAFSVSVDDSWLKWNHRTEIRRQEARVYPVDKLPFVGLRGEDLEAFEKNGYRSVRATSFTREGTTGYIVVLAKTETAFSQIEERFLLWLRHALEVDAVLQTDRPTG
jgi:hypothetical protein